MIPSFVQALQDYRNGKEVIYLNKILKSLTGEVVQLELSGKPSIKGLLVDLGGDLLVLYDGKEYLYVPLLHVKSVNIINQADLDEQFNMPGDTDVPNISVDETVSLRKVLTTAKGLFVEIYVTGNKPLHGYITNILNDYFAFYSPIYKTMYITLNHLKWLIPYSINERPYDLNNKALPLQPTAFPLARTFEIQIEKLVNELVVFNVHEMESISGKINKVEGNIVEVQTARNNSIYLNFNHLKVVHKV